MEAKIKSKLILDYAVDEELYSDGEFEEILLRLFSKDEPEDEIGDILSNNPEWPLYYHLTPDRQNLLSWYPFDKRGSLLEIGSGCGALTELFCKKLGKVTAVELTKRRATITAQRCKDYDNLTVIAGNLTDIPLNEKHDYITLIGVLEYAGLYGISENPYLNLLEKVGGLLSKNGTLILAIENKFGLKYWSGVCEDHTGNLFESIEGYPKQKGVQTFGKIELEKLLLEAGFKDLSFYYPLPDYKVPTEIFSDDYLPTPQHGIRAGLLPSVDHSRARIFLFNERLAVDNIVLNKSFGFFANSFLVFAKRY